MTPTDEAAFLTTLRVRFPYVEVVDGQRWPSEEPPVRANIADCASSEVFLWNRAITARLPSGSRPGGGFQGPVSGVVIQWLRCRQDRTSLLSGRLATGSSDLHFIEFVNGVWKVMRSFTQSDLVTLTGEAAPEFRIGPDARRWFNRNEDGRLRANSTETFFITPEAEGPRGWIPS
jgi:hypothetical protein